MNKTIFVFPGTRSATLAEVGGKGLSLLQASQAGLPVPPGFILSVSFFLPWLQHLQATKAWSEFLQPRTADLEHACQALKQHALRLSLTQQQAQDLSAALLHYDKESFFAVRSSSPEEDLEGASFAGGYETILGVTTHTIDHAIQQAFASCLDYRVTVYKHEHGFALTDPKIAVIIQEQIASDIAGVGFSLNPVTNNFDEAVLTANWGLGETVVQGIATPDTYTVDKISLRITHKQLGTKETSIWLDPNGGTTEKQDERSNQLTLSEKQVRELTELIQNVETLYHKPIDIEWAFAKNILYLLQARPITGYVPLSPEMLTNPGERKRVYLDMTISVQGITHPLSIMATSLFRELLNIVGQRFFHRDVSRHIDTTPAVVTNGRMFLNLSVLLRLLGRRRVFSFVRLFDPLAAKALADIELQDYTAKGRKFTLLPWKLSFRLPALAIRILRARRNPKRLHLKTLTELNQFVTNVQSIAQQPLPPRALADKLLQELLTHVFLKTVPLFILAISVHSALGQLAGKEQTEVFDQLGKALPNNLTTEMGLALFRVSQALPPDLTPEKLVEGLHTNSLPASFLLAWKQFLALYGFRGPEEIDVAAPRYHENPTLLLDIALTLRHAQDNTQAHFENNQLQRKQAYETLYQQLLSHNPKQARHFARLYQVYETFAGYREAHKYYAALVIDLVRQRILQEAERLYEAKRLDSVDQVFDLTLEQLDQGLKDPSLDLKALAKHNRLFLDRLSKLPSLPTLMDSRGLILKPPAQPATEGEIRGMPVSPGIAKGKVKILHTPTEKPFFKGEILVARATDPGWTPLFVNASAVILEVGGMLQHGALVAREYGLPCVTGVENATTLWEDGTVVEVDGSQGSIRMLAQHQS